MEQDLRLSVRQPECRRSLSSRHHDEVENQSFCRQPGRHRRVRRERSDELANDGIRFIERRKRNLVSGFACFTGACDRGSRRRRRCRGRHIHAKIHMQPQGPAAGCRHRPTATQAAGSEAADLRNRAKWTVEVEIDIGRMFSHKASIPQPASRRHPGHARDPAAAWLDSPSHALDAHASPVFARRVRTIVPHTSLQNLCPVCKSPLLARYDLSVAKRTLNLEALRTRAQDDVEVRRSASGSAADHPWRRDDAADSRQPPRRAHRTPPLLYKG